MKTRLFLATLALLSVLISGCEISPGIEIKAPVSEVWAYMADSSRAREWSVYFDHISALPGSPGLGVGAVRRCFRRANEQGIFWDEKVLEVQVERLRVMRTYNVTGFHEAIYNRAEYDVFQRFEPLANGNTRLTLASSLVKPRTLEGWWNALRAMPEAKRIIDHNLDNIAAAIEALHEHRAPVRVHPYEQSQRWD